MSVQIKVTSPASHEVRRLQLGPEVSFAELSQKLVQLFPDLGFCSLFWKDSDGDLVSLSSDEELQLAARCSTSPLRLFLQPQQLPHPQHSHPQHSHPQHSQQRPQAFCRPKHNTPGCAPRYGAKCPTAARCGTGRCPPMLIPLFGQGCRSGPRSGSGSGRCAGARGSSTQAPPVWLKQWIDVMSSDSATAPSRVMAGLCPPTNKESLGLHPLELVEGLLATLLEAQREQEAGAELVKEESNKGTSESTQRVAKAEQESDAAAHNADRSSVNMTSERDTQTADEEKHTREAADSEQGWTVVPEPVVQSDLQQKEAPEAVESDLQKKKAPEAVSHQERSQTEQPEIQQQDFPRSAPPSYTQAAARTWPVVEPEIAATVRQMTSMGFRDEGGWLTRLVIAQRGDISRVLDALQPACRQQQRASRQIK